MIANNSIQSLNLFKMNLKTTFTLFVIIGLTVSAAAQERSFGTLPMIQKPGVAALSGSKMDDTPKYEHALAVYNRLVQARGDFRFPVPTFSMRREERRVAGMDYGLLEIVLEEKAYDVCAGFGENAEGAIAFLLGHELTHYYEKHAWRRGFASDYKDLAIGLQLDSIYDAAANETEADYLGGFLAYSAGFGLFDKGGEVIGKLYEAYGLPQNLSGYPSLADRQTLGLRTAEKLARLVEVFDMANLLTAIGKYAEAYEYYRYIIMEYQSRELYNNLGVTAVLDALQYFNENELKFRFPVELDLESSATKGDGMVNVRASLLQQAILHFDAAISLDPGYAPAYLNKASAFALLGDNSRARFYADTEARQAALNGNYQKTVLDIDILLGILDWREGKEDKAKAAFKAAAEAGSALAARNLEILRDEPLGDETATFGGLPRPERIDGQNLALVADDVKVDRKRSITISPFLAFHQNPAQGENSRLFVNENSRTDELIFMHATGPGYQGKTARQIGLGDDRAAIVSAYGKPGRTVETPRGQIMVYKSTIFILGAEGKLERWVNYLK
jgi:tetratricopeptide (TPR) repeat protein